MAVGDVVSAHSSIADDASLTIQPGAGAEWIIHNLYYGGDCELYITDGANEFELDNFGGPEYVQLTFRVNNTVYATFKNVSGDAAYLGYDGIVTK